MERVEILNEYYTNLNYESDITQIRREIHALAGTVRFNPNTGIPERLEALANLINKNLSLFTSIFKHVDVIHTILNYLNGYATRIGNKVYVELHEFDDIPCLLVVTLITICFKEPVMQSFFLDSLIDASQDIVNLFDEIDSMLNYGKTYTESEMIILEDADLCAVISCLTITDHFPLHKIWVHERVKGKFLWLLKRCRSLTLSMPIDTFQSLNDIEFHSCDKYIVTIVSIWTEDIVTAKNFALFINSHVVFINTYMDFRGTILLPFKEIIVQNLMEQESNTVIYSELIDVDYNINTVHLSYPDEMILISICNLFYDGAWQKPVKRMYWNYNGILWANASHDDIINCYESAQRGFEVWSNKSLKTRIQILSKFMSTLKSTGKHVLAAIVERWIKLPYFYGNIQGFLTEDNAVEVTHTRKALNVVMLREENENVLFFRLMQALIAGNSVIVMFDANFSNLSSYCNMFLPSGIPPGVINMLSHENSSALEYKLCLEKYVDYANRIFLKGTSKQAYVVPYKKLTLPKQIILHVK